MEANFADGAKNRCFTRARWRRLWRQRFQYYMIATVQNIRILIRHGDLTPKAAAQMAQTAACKVISAFLAGYAELVRNLY